MAAAAKETRRNALKPSSDSPSCEARNSKDLSLLKIRRVWCVIEEGLLSSLVDPLVCVPSADWQLGMGVCVGGDRIHLLSAWLYMVCFVFPTPGQRWHIEVFISRKQVAKESDELVRMSLPPCLSVTVCVRVCVCVHFCTCTNLYTVLVSWGAYMCLPACVWMFTPYISVRVCVWYLEVCSKGE